MRYSMKEWIELYERKTREEFKPHPGFRLFYFPEKGFCELAADADVGMVMIYQMCGDGRFWKRVAETMAQALGCKTCGAIAVRHIKPFVRLWGFHITEERRLEGNMVQYTCEDAEGNTGRLRPAWWDSRKKEWAYYATWEVQQY